MRGRTADVDTLLAQGQQGSKRAISRLISICFARLFSFFIFARRASICRRRFSFSWVCSTASFKVSASGAVMASPAIWRTMDS